MRYYNYNMNTKKEKSKTKLPRPPVVVVLGHVDHGKTTLLDYIKKTKVAQKEEGGITQHIGAYEASHQDQKITFIDTPGHEAFSKMRSRGAKVADVAILVVAANEGVRVQTKEALGYIKQANIPYIVAASKVDLKDTNIPKIKQELKKEEVKLEEWGGEVPFVETSAKTPTGINDLLDVILLVAGLKSLQAKDDKPFKGVVIESLLNPQRGPEATVLVKAGFLEVHDRVVTNGVKGTVKRMEDFKKDPVSKAGPSKPVVVIGFNRLPKVGSVLVKSKPDQRQPLMEAKVPGALEIGPEDSVRVLNLVIKTDVKGTEQALLEVLEGLELKETKLRIISSSTGDISQSDIKKVQAAKGAVLGFRVSCPLPIKKFASRQGVSLAYFNVIYETKEVLEGLVKKLFPSEEKRYEIGKVKVLALFGERSGSRRIIGGKVTSGRVGRQNIASIHRKDELIGEGKVVELRREDKKIERVKKGQQCGIMYKGTGEVKKGDILRVYEVKKVAPTL